MDKFHGDVRIVYHHPSGRRFVRRKKMSIVILPSFWDEKWIICMVHIIAYVLLAFKEDEACCKCTLCLWYIEAKTAEL
jgi:hypothetical protein